MNGLSVCSYNIGLRADDYFQLCKHLNPSLSFNSKEETEAFCSKYEATQNRTTELLAGKAEVYCLQEVGDEERPLIKHFKESNFEIIHLENIQSFDTAIALDKNRFKDITNHSTAIPIDRHFTKDVAIATAIDVLSSQRITFVSAHAPGFDFTKRVNDEDAAEGDLYCRAIVKKLSEIGHNNIQIIGTDMNANPEKWKPRFQIFYNQGFQIYRKNSATNVNPKDSVDQKREIDFIFTREITSIWQKIKSIFASTIQFHTTIKAEESIAWNADNNASDHLPVFIDISYKVNISKIHQLWNATYRLFSSFFVIKKSQMA